MRAGGIAIIPVEGRPLFQDDRDSSTSALRASARNDNRCKAGSGRFRKIRTIVVLTGRGAMMHPDVGIQITAMLRGYRRFPARTTRPS